MPGGECVIRWGYRFRGSLLELHSRFGIYSWLFMVRSNVLLISWTAVLQHMWPMLIMGNLLIVCPNGFVWESCLLHFVSFLCLKHSLFLFLSIPSLSFSFSHNLSQFKSKRQKKNIVTCSRLVCRLPDLDLCQLLNKLRSSTHTHHLAKNNLAISLSQPLFIGHGFKA